ncbi:histidine kinase [Winogradskya consettensis]|uniref:histidine kinase n=2 Tax=Winogradskya consettensis TaxID=113560 RepID=A0A919SGQ4_9ACTN|nr:two-component sensor histidine kinase [Actinoplanes consettensis]
MPPTYHDGMGELAVRPAAEPSEYSFLLPAALRDQPVSQGGPRSMRDWFVDAACFLLSLVWALLCTGDLFSAEPSMIGQWAGTPEWLIWADLFLGVLCSVALWWRRRWPVAFAVLMLVLSLVSVTAAVAILISLFTVAVHRPFVTALWVGAAGFVTNAVFCVVRPEQGGTFVESFVWGIVFIIIVQLWGMTVRARRQLVVSLRDRAERAESEQRLRVAQARALERTRIAREMHDVLAHRISLLSLHAGALEFRPDAPPAEIAGAAGVIRASAHLALQDLREVIGVLRESTDDAAPERPQPTLRELPALAAESRAAGVKVRLDVAVDEAQQLPVGTGRTAYRIIQEGLTNARKHAPGTAVKVAVGGAAGAGLTIGIRNPAPVARPVVTIPGTGTGLIGLAERATLAGGTIVHGHDTQGDFVLEAWLPWPPA